MIGEIAKNIVYEVNKTLTKLYNFRKEKEGLISTQNELINDLTEHINKWYKKQVELDKKIKELK